MTVEQQLRQAFAALDEAVADHVGERHPSASRSLTDPTGPAGPTRRPWRSPLAVVAAATAVAAVVAVVAGLAVAGNQDRSTPGPAQNQNHTATTGPSPSVTSTPTDEGDTPSQGAGAAERDRVLAAVAALPFAKRVHQVAGPTAGTTEAVTGQGVWVLSRPTWPSSGCFPSQPKAGLRYDYCDTSGELLLLSSDRAHILRAFPLADQARWLVQGNGSLYVGAAADGAWPVSMLCRLPLDTLALSCRYFQLTPHLADDGPGWTTALLARWPGQHRLEEEASGLPSLDRLRVTATALIGTAPGAPSTRFDPITLKPLP